MMDKRSSVIKRVTRTRSKWKNTTKPKTTKDNADALGYIIWQLALNGAKNLHAENFRYDDDQQRLGVIEEYLAFLVHVSDRTTFHCMDNEQRDRFVTGVALAAGRHLQRNKEEIVDRGNYLDPFLGMLNERCKEYGSCSFVSNEPGYAMLRAFGSHVQDVMGTDQTNKWVIDQIMDIDAPGTTLQLKKSLANLLESSQPAGPAPPPL